MTILAPNYKYMIMLPPNDNLKWYLIRSLPDCAVTYNDARCLIIDLQTIIVAL